MKYLLCVGLLLPGCLFFGGETIAPKKKRSKPDLGYQKMDTEDPKDLEGPKEDMVPKPDMAAPDSGPLIMDMALKMDMADQDMAATPVCGDGIKNGSERCDDSDFGDATCATETSNKSAGKLTCSSDCTSIDTDQCRPGFTQVSAGPGYVCALKDGNVVCWRLVNEKKLIYFPFDSGFYTQISSGNNGVTCGVDGNGKATCTNYNGNNFVNFSRVKKIVVGKDGCKLGNNDVISCKTTTTNVDKEPFMDEIFLDLAFGNQGVIAGLNAYGVKFHQYNKPAPYSFFNIQNATQVTLGKGFACVLASDHSIKCNKTNLNIPSGMNFKQIDAGGKAICGLKTNGKVSCKGMVDPITNVNFTQISVAPTNNDAVGSYACGVKKNGTISCWGNYSYGQPPTP